VGRTLSHMRTQVRARGDWPGVVQLRRGWRSATARPWNDQSPRLAALRLERGSDRFLTTCVDWLTDVGVERTLTPALAAEQTHVWRRAGFRDHLQLVVFERDLTIGSDPPLHQVESYPDPDLEILAGIDDRAFDPTWRVGRCGLADARSATPFSEVLIVEERGGIAGFAIVGEMSSVSYLQRVAVEPTQSRRGIGRSLVRSGMEWARRRGAGSMVLNTQPENVAAAALYRDEGFIALGPKLSVLAKDNTATSPS
jgi:ribosomal protein S18 acetylase RimI-like enzyme